jgi:hypothetical protein
VSAYLLLQTREAGKTTIHKDLAYLSRQAKEILKVHIQDKLPEEYQKCMVGINQVLNMAWSIVNKSVVDDKTRLQALALINDCNKYKMDLTTNGVVVTDAIKYVQGKMDHLNAWKTFTVTFWEKKIFKTLNFSRAH